MEINYVALGKNVAKCRKLAGLTQEQLAEATSLSLGMISTVETGKTKASIETLVKLANILSTTVDVLLYDSLNEKQAILQERIRHITAGCNQTQLEFLAESLEMQKSLVMAAKNK